MTIAMPYFIFTNSALFETLQRAFNNLVLHTYMQLGKERTETSYTNNKVTVFFRMSSAHP